LKYKPYVTEYPLDVIEEKVDSLISLLRSNFCAEIASHRSGRWAINTDYIQIIKKYGICIDCSVLPFHKIPPSSSQSKSGAVDYSDCRNGLYEMNNDDFKKSGKSGIFEVPVTAFDFYPLLRPIVSNISKKISDKHFQRVKLRPEPGNLKTTIKIINNALKERLPFIEFMIHSSELMPYCSLAFPHPKDIEKLFEDLEKLFSYGSSYFEGATLKEYVEQYNTNNV
jgi:hypothetical protein